MVQVTVDVWQAVHSDGTVTEHDTETEALAASDTGRIRHTTVSRKVPAQYAVMVGDSEVSRHDSVTDAAIASAKVQNSVVKLVASHPVRQSPDG